MGGVTLFEVTPRAILDLIVKQGMVDIDSRYFRYASVCAAWAAPFTILPLPISVALGAAVVGVGLTGLMLTFSMPTLKLKLMSVLTHAIPPAIVLALGSKVGCKLGKTNNTMLLLAGTGVYWAINGRYVDKLYYSKQWLLTLSGLALGMTYIQIACHK